jgi:lysophospholipase L1-like esterase
MKIRRLILHFRMLALIAALPGHFAAAQTTAGTEHWVPTWTTALMQAPAVPVVSVGQPLTAAQEAQNGFNKQTIRMIVPVSIGGRRVRVRLSNTHGSAPLTLGSAHLALHGQGSAVVPGSDRALAFGGRPGCIIAPGATAMSDPVDLEVPALSELAVSIYVPGATSAPTMHIAGLHTTYISKQGDSTGQPSIEDVVTTQSWYWISGVYVAAPANAAAVVGFGDSITDGARSTPDTNSSWPSRLAGRMLANPGTATVAVVNQGIGGNRILRDGTGVNALGRFDEDVLSLPGVKWVILLEGINDIGQGTGPAAVPANSITAEDLIAAMGQFVEQAHLRGIRVMGGTLTPYAGAAYHSEKGEAIRETVNEWVLRKGSFDAVTDFAAATRDPEHPLQFRPAFDSGDHLHPNDAGYKAMADAIDVATFN